MMGTWMTLYKSPFSVTTDLFYLSEAGWHLQPVFHLHKFLIPHKAPTRRPLDQMKSIFITIKNSGGQGI